MNDKELYNRFEGQIQLPGFGIEAQRKLMESKVLLIGAGGLGCPCVQYLVAAGIGVVGICDGDIVKTSNLHRQIIFTGNDIGKKKVEVIKLRMQPVFPETKIIIYDTFLDNQLAIDIFPAYDIIVDCTDDINIRFLINDACILLKKPLVYGAVFQYEGQVAVFNTDSDYMNLRDLFEEINPAEVSSCNESGVLGAVTGITGTMQALEAIKLITGIGGLLKNELLIFNLLTYNHYKVAISKSAGQILYPATVQEFLNKNYKQACLNIHSVSSALTRKEFLHKIETGNVQVVDVRNSDEMPVIDFFQYENIPLHDLLAHPEKIDFRKTILLFCHAGVRSQVALDFLIEECRISDVFHLKGGLLKWNQYE